MKIDSMFDPSRLNSHFRNLKGRIDGAAGRELRKDLHDVKGASQSDDPQSVKDAIDVFHTDMDSVVDLRQMKTDIKQIRADFKSGVSPEQLKGDLDALKAKLNSFVEESGTDLRANGIVVSLRNAIANTVHRMRHSDGDVAPTPAPVDPVAADGAEPVTPAPGSVDFSA